MKFVHVHVHDLYYSEYHAGNANQIKRYDYPIL